MAGVSFARGGLKVQACSPHCLAGAVKHHNLELMGKPVLDQDVARNFCKGQSSFVPGRLVVRKIGSLAMAEARSTSTP
jgi:hypothetical protein